MLSFQQFNEYTIIPRRDFFDDEDYENYFKRIDAQKSKYKKVSTPISDVFDVGHSHTGVYHDYALFDKKTGKAVGVFGLDEKPLKQNVIKSGISIVIPHLMLNKEYQNKGIGKRIYRSFLENGKFVYATNEHTREAKILWDSITKLSGMTTQTIDGYRYLGKKEYFSNINEAAYAGNLGFMELVKFHKKATPDQKKQLQSHIQNKKHEEFRNLIKSVTGVQLHKSVNEKIDPDILPKAGAGQEGTGELVKTYMCCTPGQSIKKYREYIKQKY
jgi:hypothetical protein